ncbi:MAG: metal-dependent hydrolase [Planctomycetaceae bacterium]|nr:metal-dependent hydrolase [Planctomycetaceae bacterium]
MGSFFQHITCSTAAGVALGGAASVFGFPLPVCGVSAGLCSVAGMLPDIDSDTSKSFQECIYLAAGLGSALLVQRLRHLPAGSGHLDPDITIICAAAMFLFIRFGIGWCVKRLTVHRGMFHSIPAAVLSGEIVYLLAAGTPEERLLKGAAAVTGYLSHLILDEVFSIDSTGQVFKPLRLKKSFGTALKFGDPKRTISTFLVYAAICPLTYTVLNEWQTDKMNVAADKTADSAIVGSNIAVSVQVIPAGIPLVPALKSEDTVFSQAALPKISNTSAAQPSPGDDLTGNYMPPLPQDLPPSMPLGSEFVPQYQKAAPAPIILP